MQLEEENACTLAAVGGTLGGGLGTQVQVRLLQATSAASRLRSYHLVLEFERVWGERFVALRPRPRMQASDSACCCKDALALGNASLGLLLLKGDISHA